MDEVLSIHVSKHRGEAKCSVKEAHVIVGQGIEGDAHCSFRIAQACTMY